MKYNHYCKECELFFSFLTEAEPKTKEEIKFCEENDSETLLTNPSKKEEEKDCTWMYYDDSSNWTEIPANKEELEEYSFCNKCKKFIQRRWL